MILRDLDVKEDVYYCQDCPFCGIKKSIILRIDRKVWGCDSCGREGNIVSIDARINCECDSDTAHEHFNCLQGDYISRKTKYLVERCAEDYEDVDMTESEIIEMVTKEVKKMIKMGSQFVEYEDE